MLPDTPAFTKGFSAGDGRTKKTKKPGLSGLSSASLLVFLLLAVVIVLGNHVATDSA
jgi:hypothetical protein